MNISMASKRLCKLYETGLDKKLPKGISEQFFAVVAILESAETIHNIQAFTSRKFEKMQGRKGQFSLRLNKQYRLIIEFDDPLSPTEVILIEITDYH